MHTNPDAPIELYDLSIDVGEQNNMAFDHPEIVKKITDIMKKEHAYSKEFSFTYEREN